MGLPHRNDQQQPALWQQQPNVDICDETYYVRAQDLAYTGGKYERLEGCSIPLRCPRPGTVGSVVGSADRFNKTYEQHRFVFFASRVPCEVASLPGCMRLALPISLLPIPVPCSVEGRVAMRSAAWGHSAAPAGAAL